MNFFMNVHVKLYFMMYDVDSIFTPCGKGTDVKCKVMDINFAHILNNIITCLVGGCITHQNFLISYVIS
jgi:hypothetical protein